MNKRIRFPLHYLIGFLLFWGCAVESKGIDENIKNIDKNIKEIEKSITDIQNQIDALQSKIFLLELEQKSYTSIYIDPSVRTFQRINTSSGFFLISCADVRPFPGGYKMMLSIGNPSSAIYNGFKLKVKWGKKFDYKQTSLRYDAWEKSLKEKAIDFVNELRAGSWNKVELILSPAKSEELEHIELSMQTDHVSLIERGK